MAASEHGGAQRVAAGCPVATLELGEGLTGDALGGAAGDIGENPGVGALLVAHGGAGGLGLVVVATLVDLFEGGDRRQDDAGSESAGGAGST
jgi:hypothetical protein